MGAADGLRHVIGCVEAPEAEEAAEQRQARFARYRAVLGIDDDRHERQAAELEAPALNSPSLLSMAAGADAPVVESVAALLRRAIAQERSDTEQ